MSFLNSLNISGSGMTAQKLRMDIIAQNLANSGTTRTDEGGTYRRKLVVFKESENNFSSIYSKASELVKAGGVTVDSVVEDQSEFKIKYDPDNPDADENGYVSLPNVDSLEEMIDMISATRSYEANITAFNAIKYMASKALTIGQ